MKEGLENQLQMVFDECGCIGRVVEGERGEDVDEVFEPRGVLSKQMTEASASDLAIEDVIYSIDKAVQEGVIPFDQYLKSVRSLSRYQFLQRAMCMEIMGTQMQAHVASMATRSSQYVM